MTDYRSVETLQVFRRDQHVADLSRTGKGCKFAYTEAFLAGGDAKVALHLPKTREPLTVEGVVNLPTYFAGLLPEGIMLSAIRRVIGSAADDLFAVLAATGADAIGDIDVRIPGNEAPRELLDLDSAVDLIQTVLGPDGRMKPELAAAIAGVQPKLSLGEIMRATRKARYIAKFNPPEYPSLVENEFDCMRLASRCGLETAQAKLEKGALVVTRFDRVYVSGALRKVHVEDMLQVMDLFPNSKYSHEYRDLVEAMARVGVSKAVLLDAIRLFVFSYLIGNGDLHAKNVSLMFDGSDGMWRLAPAYDLVSTLPYGDILPAADRMAIALEDEAFGRFSVDDFVKFGSQFALPAKAVGTMVRRTASALLKQAPLLQPRHLSAEVFETMRERAQSLLS